MDSTKGGRSSGRQQDEGEEDQVCIFIVQLNIQHISSGLTYRMCIYFLFMGYNYYTCIYKLVLQPDSDTREGTGTESQQQEAPMET